MVPTTWPESLMPLAELSWHAGREVGDRAVVPQDGMGPPSCALTSALPTIWPTMLMARLYAVSPPEGAEVGHHAVLPEERVRLGGGVVAYPTTWPASLMP